MVVPRAGSGAYCALDSFVDLALYISCLFVVISCGFYGRRVQQMRTLYFCHVVSSSFSFCLLSIFFSSPNLSRHRLDVCHTSTHGVALVRI